MPTYYEILQVSPTTTVAEIETACEEQYNHWRRLVTHHDPNMVNKANQALQWLETMRATLTDPAKREEYDASIGLRGPVGGLADPQAGTGVAVPTPPPPRPRSGPQSSPAPATGERVDAWICPQCQAVSPVGTQFCKKCGHTLGRQCPKCGELIEATVPFCSQCGVDIEASIAEQERLAEEQRRREQEEAQQRAEEARRQAEEQARRKAKEREQRRRASKTAGCVVAVLVVVGIAWAIVAGTIKAVEQRQYRTQATATAEQRQANATATAEKEQANATATAMRKQANATATVEAIIAAGGIVDDHGVPIAEVPAGSFMMGSSGGHCRYDETPPHRVSLDTFWIDVYEVTNARYAECVDAGVCTLPHGSNSPFDPVGKANYPVYTVNWYQANAYCRWRGGRLPTEAEWEYAARGPRANEYPWGNQEPEKNVHYSSGTLKPVGTYPRGASWVGAYDMAGNVWEWTQGWYEGYPGTTHQSGLYGGKRKVVRGGGYTNSGFITGTKRSTNRECTSPDTQSSILGFRCVRSTPSD